jgi:hypothetical protein
MTDGTPISRPLRAWLAVEVMFGVVAVLSIGIAPAESKTNFAWPIQPVVMAAVLGAFYMTTAPLFILPLLAKRWENIRVMILPATVFTAVQLVVTFLHWEKFSVGSTPFWVWFASYVLPPPILLAAYLWHQRRAKPRGAPADPIAPGLKRLMLGLGGVFLAAGTVFFLIPSLLIPHFPWKLTPLTTRSLCGWLLLVGLMLWTLAREGDRTRARLATPMLMALLPALVFQISRYWGEVNAANPVLWLGGLLFAVVGACGVVLARGSWRAALG